MSQTPPRLFVKSDLSPNISLTPTTEQARYLFSVMRRRVNDRVRLFNGRDGEWAASVQTDRQLEIQSLLREQQMTSATEIWCTPLRSARNDLLVEKLTELGVGTIRYVTTARTTGKIGKINRLQRIAIEAAEQSERLDLPTIIAPEPLAETMNAISVMTILFCDESGNDAAKAWGGRDGLAPPLLAQAAGLSARTALLIGPEGGFTPQERAFLQAHDKVRPVSLGPLILRAETAAIAAMTLWVASQSLHKH